MSDRLPAFGAYPNERPPTRSNAGSPPEPRHAAAVLTSLDPHDMAGTPWHGYGEDHDSVAGSSRLDGHHAVQGASGAWRGWALASQKQLLTRQGSSSAVEWSKLTRLGAGWLLKDHGIA